MIDEINRLRRENGCDVALQRSAELTAAARTHSRDMAENRFFNHRGSDESDRIARAQRAGYVGRSGTRVRENIGAGPVPANVVAYWMNLASIHHSQLLDYAYNDIGVGTPWARQPVHALLDGQFRCQPTGVADTARRDDAGTTFPQPPAGAVSVHARFPRRLLGIHTRNVR